MTSSEATGRSQSSRGHPGVVDDGATRLVEPDPRLPGKLRCGRRRGERRLGRPIARAKARLANRARTPGRYGGVGDLPPKRPRTLPRRRASPSSTHPAARSRSARAASCTQAGSATRRLLRNPPTRTLHSAGRTAQGCPIYPPGEDSLRVPTRDTRFRPQQSGTEPPIRRRAPNSARTRCSPTRRRRAQPKARPTHQAPTADFRSVDS